MHPSEAAHAELAERARPMFYEHGGFECEVELVRHDGQPFWAHLRGRSIVRGARGHGRIWILDDVTDAREHRDRLAWASSHDALTGLTNRAAFESLLEQATEHAAERPFCALFIDLDRFKEVNDGGGHAAGDALLRELSSRLAAKVRKSDTVARLGGDEFAVLLSDCPLSQAHTIAEQLRAAVVSYKLNWEGRDFSVGASIGLVRVDASFTSAAGVLSAADAACYQAKRQGRDRVSAHGTPLRGAVALRIA
jgi:diguanylate cyclase (GGDEF)-like protein